MLHPSHPPSEREYQSATVFYHYKPEVSRLSLESGKLAMYTSRTIPSTPLG